MNDQARTDIILLHTKQREYGLRLVGDLSDDDMLAQPFEGVTMNHPAWILSHLNVYAPLLADMLRANPVEDPINARYGRGSRVESDPSEYLPRAELIQQFEDVHVDAVRALEECPMERFEAPTPVERWRESVFPTISVLPAQFLVSHLGTHLGQLSAWRRAMGKPSV
ncbi:MAG: DinB family protein [Phycisphaerales bacterium JB043]